MASKTQLSNMALHHLGQTKNITDLDEHSTESKICNLFFSLALDKTLAAHRWKFAMVVAPLALVKESPSVEWAFAYRYPNNCLKDLRIISGIYPETQSDKIRYKIYSDQSGRLVYTDKELAELEYTSRVEDPNLYPPNFMAAFSYQLASLIAPGLTKGDPYKIKRDLVLLFDREIVAADLTKVNDLATQEQPESEYITIRI